MNEQTDYNTRFWVTVVIIVCATALRILNMLSEANWMYLAAAAGAVYFGVKLLKDSTVKNGGMKTDYNSLIATAIKETAKTITEMKDGGQSNGKGNDQA